MVSLMPSGFRGPSTRLGHAAVLLGVCLVVSQVAPATAVASPVPAVVAGPVTTANPFIATASDMSRQTAVRSLRRCASAPTPGSTIADPPWTQLRYDLNALSQINDGAGVTVAVADSGVDATHPQLAGAVTAGPDLLSSRGNTQEDCLGHGTAVASIIAARPVAGSGLRGLAPAARILSIRVSERAETDGVVTGDGNVAELVGGITAAVNQRPRPAVLNLSIATSTDAPALRQAVAAALDAGIVVVAAAGNQHERGDPTPFPAAYPGVIGVGAIGPDNARVASSQVGSYVDLVAPGDQVLVAVPGGGHSRVQGTSFATAFVSATAALIRSRWPDLPRAEVERRLLASADPAAGDRDGYGAGVLNPLRALTDVIAPGAAQPVAATTPHSVAVGVPADANPTPAGRDRVLVAVAVLLLVAAGVCGLAVAGPAGRRRRWRPGRITEP